ncbi:MAG: CysB family HTH-type transcriptional regulator [Betaproteobacteria bacterium]|nr:MAG: CysB family HTH-type transcriptional regulator [Betaproteobacteria bacterium]
MNLRQLRSLCEVVDRGLRISEAAQAMFRSQPSVSRQMQELEAELGIPIFRRKRNRVLELTPQGREVLAIARRIVNDIDNLGRLGKEFAQGNSGEFAIATTHTQARYTLPDVVERFQSAYPNVRLSLRQGTPAQCCELVQRRQADLAICTETSRGHEELVQLACYRLNRSVVTPKGHPLLRAKPLTLQAIARYPVITYDEGFSGRAIVDQAFAEKSLKPSVVLSAIDADVSKTYVEKGLGIAILATVAFDAKRDANLRCLDARHLFPPSRLNVVVRRDVYLRGFMIEFIRLFAPALRKADLEQFLAGEDAAPVRSNLPEL